MVSLTQEVSPGGTKSDILFDMYCNNKEAIEVWVHNMSL